MANKSRACVSKHRLSKISMLSMLGPPPEPGEQYSSSKSRAFYEKIPDDNWTIVSFDSLTQVVCTEITDRIGTRTTSVTLPYLTVDALP